nr:NAD(P)-dependent oxidoreductase [Rhizobium sp. SSM4.3]
MTARKKYCGPVLSASSGVARPNLPLNSLRLYRSLSTKRQQGNSYMALTYGFIGLGHLGRHLAGSLVRGGFSVIVHDLDPDNAKELLAAGARFAADPQAVAEAADAVITCLPSPRVSERVLTGERGILKGLKPGGTWIEMSTLDEQEVLRLGKIAADAGVRMLESPVTGGVHLAASGEITVIIGGDSDLYDLHLPAFQAMGNQIFRAGPLGKASVIKVITNMLAFIHLIATGEALMLAKKGGIDLTDGFNIIKASSGNSFVHETEGQVILNGSYNINFTMDLAVKDLGFALGFGRDFGVPLDLASHALQTFIRARAAYGGDAWSSQVVKLLEDATGTDLRAPGFPAEL